MADLEKVIKVTQSQYDILASGGSVGSYVGLSSGYIYLVEDTTQYATVSMLSAYVPYNGANRTLDLGYQALRTDRIEMYNGDDDYDFVIQPGYLFFEQNGAGAIVNFPFPSINESVAYQNWVSSNFQAKGNYAPSAHASTGTTYGAGTTANYGHVKLVSGNVSGTTYTDGIAAAASHNHNGVYLAANTNYTSKIKIGTSTTEYAPSSGIITLPAYPTIPASLPANGGNASSLAGQSAAYYASAGALVNADWNATSGLSSIKNKPTLGAAAAKAVTNSITSTSTDLPTASAVYTAIDNLPEPMVFKGTLGTGGTITSLPAAAAGNEGYTYKVITAGTYASQAAKVGDVFVSNGSAWVLIPAGDTDSDTWRNIKVNGTELLGTAISTGAVNFKSGNNVTITGSGNDITISAADTHYASTFTIYGGTTSVATFNQSANMTLSIVAGNNITLTPDATNHKITISGVGDTHYTSTWSVYAGSTLVSTFNQSANRSITFSAGSNITLTATANSGVLTISASDTTYGAEKGISLTSGKFGHTNTAITAQTTQALYPIKIDAYGHITGYGTAVTIPTVYNGTLTVQKNGTNVGTFTANQSTNSTINITVPDPANYYWANIKVAAASATNTAPTFATASLTSLYFMSGTTSKAYMQYNATEECIDFIFN